MVEDLEEEYPEAAPYILDAVEEHGEEWVLENYYPQVAELRLVMDVPEKEELPFYDEDKHETMSEEEKIKMAEAWSEYRENLRTGTKPGEE